MRTILASIALVLVAVAFRGAWGQRTMTVGMHAQWQCTPIVLEAAEFVAEVCFCMSCVGEEERG